jgi:hypothetical protein
MLATVGDPADTSASVTPVTRTVLSAVLVTPWRAMGVTLLWAASLLPLLAWVGERGILAPAAIMVAILGFFMVMPQTVTIDRHGVSKSWLGRTTALEWSDVVQVDAYASGLAHDSSTRGIELRTRDGRRMRIPVTHGPFGSGGEALHRRLHDAWRAAVEEPPLDVARLERGGRGFDVWAAELRGMDARAGGPRVAPLPVEVVDRALEHRQAPAHVRVAAAVAIAARGEEGRTRVSAAASAASGDLRRWLEQAADAEDEAAVAALLEEAEAARCD